MASRDLRAELTGRDEELPDSRYRWRSLAVATAKLWLWSGRRAAGKSRLVAELKDATAHLPEPCSMAPRPLPGCGHTRRLWPFLEILRGYFAWTTQDDDQSRRADMARCLAAMVERGGMSPQRAATGRCAGTAAVTGRRRRREPERRVAGGAALSHVSGSARFLLCPGRRNVRCAGL